MALKYHPKNDSSFQAAEKFIEISQAYEMLNPMKKTENKKKMSQNTYMSDFNRVMKDYLGAEMGVKQHQGKSKVMDADLYSESKNVKRVGDKK